MEMMKHVRMFGLKHSKRNVYILPWKYGIAFTGAKLFSLFD